ncbi:MAG: TVP38/TMEM64 family protein [Acetivibrio ethanolgignens]
MENKKKKKTGKLLLLVTVLLAMAAYFFLPAVRQLIRDILQMFASGDFIIVRRFVESYGPYAAVISFLLMILQSIVAPLPAFLLTFANASLFGWWKGAILSWSSAMAGAAACFWIARILGRDAVEKLTSRSGLKQIDEFFDRYGRQSCRTYRHVIWQLSNCDRNRAASGNDCIFLCRGHADWRGKTIYNCTAGAFCYFSISCVT